MRIETDKQAEEPIHFNELFGKARRNALFWAAVTFLLPWGQEVKVTGEGTERVASDALIELSPLLRNFGFEHWQLVTVSLVVLIFMALGFLRASSDMRVKNSIPAVAARLLETADHFATLKAEAAQAQAQIASAVQNVTKHQATIDHHRMVLDQAFRGIIDELPPAINGPVSGMSHFRELEQRDLDEKPVKPEHIQTFYNAHFAEMVSWAKERTETIAKRFNRALDDMEIPVGPIQLTASVETAVVDALSRTGTQIDKLREMSTQIDQNDRRWYNGFDIGLTWAAIVLAAFTAAGFLMEAALPDGRYTWPFG